MMGWWGSGGEERHRQERDILLRVSQIHRELGDGFGRVLASLDNMNRILGRASVSIETTLAQASSDRTLMAHRIEELHAEVLRLSSARVAAEDHATAETVQAVSRVTDKKLDVIHGLVNDERSKMLERMEDLHDEVRRLHAQILALSNVRQEAAGHERGMADQKQADRTAFKPPPEAPE